MMKLLSNSLSPYGRKVKIAMGLKGLKDRIEIVPVDTNIVDNPVINRPNPLAKIPALVVDGSTAIYDSHVICEYLDSLAPAPVLFPKSGVERIKTLTLGALTDGIWMPHFFWSTRSASGPRRNGTRPGRSASRPKSTGHWIIWNRHRQAGRRARTTVTSHSPARSAISISATTANGALHIPGSWPGSTALPRRCRRSRRHGRRCEPRSDHNLSPDV